MMILRRAILIVCFLFVATPAFALDCARAPGGGGYWAYRLVDGRACWYRGEHGMAKAKLHWAVASARVPRAQPAPTDFAARWRGSSSDWFVFRNGTLLVGPFPTEANARAFADRIADPGLTVQMIEWRPVE
jgi:hypothetical protein